MTDYPRLLGALAKSNLPKDLEAIAELEAIRDEQRAGT